MNRCVCLGLCLALAACSEDESKKVVAKLCPNVTPQASPVHGFASHSAGLTSVERSAQSSDDGRESVIVRLKPGADLSALSRSGAHLGQRYARSGSISARVFPSEKQALSALSGVAGVEPDRPVKAFGIGSGLALGARRAFGRAPVQSGNINEYMRGVKMVQAPQVWDADGDGVLDPGAPTGAGIKVCVIDSGIDPRHPELQVPVVAGWDFVDGDADPTDKSGLQWGLGHGTHVAATIAAQLGSGGKINPNDVEIPSGGTVGVAPGVELLIARVLDIDGSGKTSSVIAAIEWCQTQGARVLSLSLGSALSSVAEEQAFDAALAAGVLSVAAAGNDGNDVGLAYPAGYANVLAVGAVKADETLAEFSQTGFKPDVQGLVAPGVEVISAILVDGDVYAQELQVGSALFPARSLEFASVGAYEGSVVDCGLGDTMGSCGEAASCDGFVAFVRRGGLTFSEKVRNVRAQGARAVIIANNDPASPIDNLTFDQPDAWIPTVAITVEDGDVIKQAIGQTAKVSLGGVDYARSTGTSMAAPHVSGVAALVWSAKPELTAQQVREALIGSAKALGPVEQFGAGLVQSRAAVQRVASQGARPGVGAR